MFGVGVTKSSNFYFTFLGGIIFGISLTLLTNRVNISSIVYRQACRIRNSEHIRMLTGSALPSSDYKSPVDVNATQKKAEENSMILVDDTEKHKGIVFTLNE